MKLDKLLDNKHAQKKKLSVENFVKDTRRVWEHSLIHTDVILE